MKNELIEKNVEQGSPEWLALRKNYIGSSDAASIMGVSKWTTEYQAWQEKLDLVPAKQENSAMRRGKDLEPIARDIFEQSMGIKISPKVFVKNFMIASMDGVSDDNSIAVEIKCPNYDDHELASHQIVPGHYYPQLQHQMMVLGISKMYYLSYTPYTQFHFIVNRNDDYCEKLLDKEKKFWDYVRMLEAPPLVDRDYEPKSSLTWHEITTEINHVRKQMKLYEGLKDREEELKKRLIEESGGRNCMGNGFKLSCSMRRGHIDYDAIPQLKNIDLEKYRKKTSTVWRLGEV